MFTDELLQPQWFPCLFILLVWGVGGNNVEVFAPNLTNLLEWFTKPGSKTVQTSPGLLRRTFSKPYFWSTTDSSLYWHGRWPYCTTTWGRHGSWRLRKIVLHRRKSLTFNSLDFWKRKNSTVIRKQNGLVLLTAVVFITAGPQHVFCFVLQVTSYGLSTVTNFTLGTIVHVPTVDRLTRRSLDELCISGRKLHLQFKVEKITQLSYVVGSVLTCCYQLQNYPGHSPYTYIIVRYATVQRKLNIPH